MLNLKFVNQSGVPDNQIFVTAYSDSDQPYDVSFFDIRNIITPLERKHSQTLATLHTSGINIKKLSAGRFYISFKQGWKIPLDATGRTPSAVDPSDPWFHTEWDKIEVTMNGDPGDQANLTSIDFVGIPMRMETRDAHGKVLQDFGYPDNNHIVSTLAKLNKQAVITDTGDPSGKIVRVLGPSQSGYPSVGGWPAFTDYIAAVKAAGQKTKIKFEISHSVDPKTNWRYQYDFVATVNADNSITMNGTISAQNTVPDPSRPTDPPIVILSGPLSIAFTADDPNNTADTFLSSFIYAGAGNVDAHNVSNVNYSVDWAGFFSKTTAVAMEDVQKRIIGDLSVGFAYGFVGSTKFKDSPSGDWFAPKQTLAVSQLQPQHPFYSIYENAIFHEAIGHKVYGHPYSDRLSEYHVAANVVKFEDKDVKSLIVTIPKLESTTGLLRHLRR